jgi:hypothetical protein
VNWQSPTTNSDGTPLTNLAGFHIHYGTSSTNLLQTIQVASASATSQVVSNLTAGTWYFAVTAYTNSGSESNPSSVVSKTL